MKFAVVPLALGQPVDELCIAQGDRRRASEHPQGLDLAVVEGVHVGTAHPEDATKRVVVLDRCEDDRARAGSEAARNLRPRGRAQNCDVATEEALVAECRDQWHRLALEL